MKGLTLCTFALIAIAIAGRVAAVPVVPKIFFLDRLLHHNNDHADEGTEAHFEHTPEAPEPLGHLEEYDDYHYVDESRHQLTPEYEDELARRAALVDHEARFLAENEYREHRLKDDEHWEPTPAHASHGFDHTIQLLKDLHHDHLTGEAKKDDKHKIIYYHAKPFGKPALMPAKTVAKTEQRTQTDAPKPPGSNDTESKAALSGDHSVFAAKLFDGQSNGTAHGGAESDKHAEGAAPGPAKASIPTTLREPLTTFSTDAQHIFDREKGKA